MGDEAEKLFEYTKIEFPSAADEFYVVSGHRYGAHVKLCESTDYALADRLAYFWRNATVPA